ncbi:hypothetical protein D3C71_1850960 [compost metagenome]
MADLLQHGDHPGILAPFLQLIGKETQILNVAGQIFDGGQHFVTGPGVDFDAVLICGAGIGPDLRDVG